MCNMHIKSIYRKGDSAMKKTFIFLLICIMILGSSSITSFAEVFGDGYQYDTLEEAYDEAADKALM